MAEEVVITRIIDAPRERVWWAWTDAEQIKRWWGPRGYTSPVQKVDLRVGGEYLGAMRSPEGREYWSKGVYREIVPLEKLVATDSFADEHGNVVPASYYGMSGDWPVEMLVTVTFEEQDGKTKLTVRHSGLERHSETDIENMRQGWSETLDKLEEFVAGRMQAAA